MKLRLPLLIALLATVLWAGLNLLASLPGALDRAVLESAVIIAAPALIFWALALTAVVKSESDDRQRSLQNQIENLRSLLANYNSQLNSLAGPADGKPAPEIQTAVADRNGADGEPPPHIQPLPVSRDMLVRAVNLAESEEDTETLQALDAAAHDPDINELLSLAMQLLQPLADSDLAVDLLPAEFAEPVEWRSNFPRGGQNPVSRLGRVGNANHHATVKALLDGAPDLKEAADRFTGLVLNLADRFIPEASDRQILAFANTRSLRACILFHCAQGETGS